MNFTVILASYSVIIPIIAGLVRRRRLGKRYQPLFILLVAGLATELVSTYLTQTKHASNAGVTNAYALLEWLMIFWQFRAWGFFRTPKAIAWTVLLVPCMVWIAENLVLRKMNDSSPYFQFSPYFRITYGALIVLLSVNKINFMITHDDRNLLGHPEFLICIGFIIYFIYDIIYEWAYLSSSTGETYITSKIISLFDYINALTNIIFAIAFLRIPPPKKLTLW
jgi:hypothetical protein